jgi:hypothetical protein
MNIRIASGLGVIAVAGLLISIGLNAPASAQTTASPCKGLDAAACKAKSATCTWIAPKKGKQKPYCRAKPAKKKK